MKAAHVASRAPLNRCRPAYGCISVACCRTLVARVSPVTLNLYPSTANSPALNLRATYSRVAGSTNAQALYSPALLPVAARVAQACLSESSGLTSSLHVTYGPTEVDTVA